MQENLNFTSDSSSSSSETEQAIESITNHFWVVSDQALSTMLVVTPGSSSIHQHKLVVYDASGDRASEIQLSFPKGQIGLFDLEGICGDCKCTSGIRQAHLEVTSAPGTQHQCFYKSKNKDLNISSEQKINARHAAFFPIRLSDQSSNTLAIYSQSSPECSVKCRLYTGTRAPEAEFRVPARGAVSINIETEFADYLDLNASKEIQGYIRLVSNASTETAVRLIEKKYKRTNYMEEVK